MDVGAGDGHASLHVARNEASTLAIALDPSIDRLRDGARTAMRGKLPNAQADPAVIRPLARLAKAGAAVRVLVSVKHSDAAIGLPPLDATALRNNAAALSACGFRLDRCEPATTAEIRASGSSWARRLGEDRHVFALELRRV